MSKEIVNGLVFVGRLAKTIYTGENVNKLSSNTFDVWIDKEGLTYGPAKSELMCFASLRGVPISEKVLLASYEAASKYILFNTISDERKLSILMQLLEAVDDVKRYIEFHKQNSKKQAAKEIVDLGDGIL